VLDARLAVGEPRGGARPEKRAGDKAYRAKRIRRGLADEGIQDVLPSQAGDAPVDLDEEVYKRRNLIERRIGWLKQWRAVATRYDTLARNDCATLTLSLIERCLRAAG